MGNKKTNSKKEMIEEYILGPNNKTPDELLGHYFSIDGNTATVKFYFDTFAELVDQNFGDDHVERLNSTLFEKIADVFSLIPRKYFINMEVYIRDFGDYSIEEAEKIIQDNIRLKIYAFELEQRRKYLTGIMLVIGGAFLLFTSYLLNNLALPQLLYDIINISGTLLVWESANVMIIERSAETKQIKQLAKKFKKVRILKA